MEKEKFSADYTKKWLVRQTIKENRKNYIFVIAMRKARAGSKRAGSYLRKKYGIMKLWNGERMVKF